MQISRRYLISGSVQGVGFRYFVQRAGVQEGVTGWVRNLPGGSVEVEASGEPAVLERFERQIRKGPPAAHVTNVDVTDVTPGEHGDHKGFIIR